MAQVHEVADHLDRRQPQPGIAGADERRPCEQRALAALGGAGCVVQPRGLRVGSDATDVLDAGRREDVPLLEVHLVAGVVCRARRRQRRRDRLLFHDALVVLELDRLGLGELATGEAPQLRVDDPEDPVVRVLVGALRVGLHRAAGHPLQAVPVVVELRLERLGIVGLVGHCHLADPRRVRQQMAELQGLKRGAELPRRRQVRGDRRLDRQALAAQQLHRRERRDVLREARQLVAHRRLHLQPDAAVVGLRPCGAAGA